MLKSSSGAYVLKPISRTEWLNLHSNDNTSTLTSTDSCNDSIDFHFPSFDNYLDSSYSKEEDSFASKLIKNLFPTKSDWTPPDGRFSSLNLYIETCRDQISKITSDPNLITQI